MRGCVLACFVLSLLAPPLLQVAHAARRAWAPWAELCSTDDPRQPPAPAPGHEGWLFARASLALQRPQRRKAVRAA